MTSLRDSDASSQEERRTKKESKDLAELPPIGTSLHKRRRGEPPATLTVNSSHTPSEGSSPCTAGPTPEESWSTQDEATAEPVVLCEKMLQRLKDKDDPLSKRGRQVASQTKDTLESVDQLEKLLELLDQFVTLKEQNNRLVKRLRDVEHLKRLRSAHKRIQKENEKLKDETKEMELLNEALESELDYEYGQAIFDSMVSGSKSMKRSTSRWKAHSRFGGSLLRRQRSRSAGGEESDATPGTPLRRKSDGIFNKEVEKSKVSNWTRVKAAFKWEKAQWPSATGGAAAVAAGAMVGAVALAGSSPTSTLAHPEPRDSASLTPGSALSLTPNSSCEELRIDSGVCRRSGQDHENIFLQAPVQDDSSASPSPNKLHKSPWVKMRDIIQTHRESVKKKTKGSKSPDAVPPRRRSFSDGGDSDAPPALTLTIPSSEELESEGSHHVLRKQRSLELGGRAAQHRPPRDSKWTRVKRAFLTSASASVPSSPSRHSAFFTDGDTEGVSSGCEAGVREEIARDYAALQTRLGREFSDRRGKLPAITSSRPVATEEQLSADFRKKLTEWQRMKGVRQPPPVPARQDLSEDFLKRWDAWTRMKETNSVPAWEGEAKPDEVLVQTSTGLFKFKGISRSFTRKLHEWEKSRGIAPEASTSALLQAARARAKQPTSPLTRTQSDGSVAPSLTSASRRHASSLSVNDADDLDSEYEREQMLDGGQECEGPTRSALLVEVEAEEVCTAAPLVAVSPRHTPQTPVYTYGPAEARLLCETTAAVTGTAVLQPTASDQRRVVQKKQYGEMAKPRHDQEKLQNKRLKIIRQPSIEEDAKFIRKTIEEIERGSSQRYKEENIKEVRNFDNEIYLPSTSKIINTKTLIQQETDKEYNKMIKENNGERNDERLKEIDRNNGKKKSRSRVRLEREQSKPSETDTEPDVDTVTVEIPRRKKRPRRPSERPRTPPAAMPSDTEGEVFVLKLKAPEQRDISPEVIVKTTRKIFSPVVRIGETTPRAVIGVKVEDLDEVRPAPNRPTEPTNPVEATVTQDCEKKPQCAEDTQEDDQRSKARPPLPLSPPSQRKPSPKETSPSIRIMIQRYNNKINEEGPVSGVSSGAASPPWRSPKSERRRPPDMPVGVTIRCNPFLEREVQKSASACQLSRRDQTSAEKSVATTNLSVEGVLKSHSANALHPEEIEKQKNEQLSNTEVGKASTDTITPRSVTKQQDPTPTDIPPPVVRQQSEVAIPTFSSFVANTSIFDRSLSVVDTPSTTRVETDVIARLSDRAAKIREAREKFLFSSPMRREGTSSASDLRPADRSSRISCESDVTEQQGGERRSPALQRTASALGRSASTGMVNVERDTWQRVHEGPRRERPRSRFSLARLAAKLRRREESAVSRLCRQSLLVQLRK